MTGRADAPASLALQGVYKRFGRKDVLCGLDLAVRSGETFTILGGSGSGKSVSLKHMIGLLRPDRGRVWFEGRDVTDLSELEWVEVRKQMGFVFQGAALFDSISVYENVAYPLREHRSSAPEPEVAARVRFCLEAVDLAGSERLMPAELSGGMRKRVGVARAIALEPHVILYDEPTTGLDPANSRRVGELIRALQERLGVTSVVVTHDLGVCFDVSDRIGLLKAGRIVAEGSPDEVRASRQRDVTEFLAGAFDDEAGARP
jgi:phospholipid/cholesterol/gamma-HCH transport system ATP-binding protein